MANSQHQMGLVAYNFEPQLSAEEIAERNSQMESNEAAANQPVEEWCQCGECQQMPVEERVCCRESDLVLPNLDDHECITHHESFSNLMLNPEVLSLAYIQMMMFKGQQGRAPDELNHRLTPRILKRLFSYNKTILLFLCLCSTLRDLGRPVRFRIKQKKGGWGRSTAVFFFCHHDWTYMKVLLFF